MLEELVTYLMHPTSLEYSRGGIGYVCHLILVTEHI